jgi:hypothetical protein
MLSDEMVKEYVEAAVSVALNRKVATPSAAACLSRDIRKTIIFSQASANDEILRHEGV